MVKHFYKLQETIFENSDRRIRNTNKAKTLKVKSGFKAGTYEGLIIVLEYGDLKAIIFSALRGKGEVFFLPFFSIDAFRDRIYPEGEARRISWYLAGAKFLVKSMFPNLISHA